MKILVVGATGKTGRLVVDRALAAGHMVVALVHDPKDTERNPLPTGAGIVHGDVQNPTRLEHAMQGCEAVIDTLGGKTPWKATELEANAAQVVLEVMDRVDAKRLIVISVLGAGESKEQAPWMYEHILMPTFLHGAIPDKNKMESEVRASHVEWVLVRPPVLNDDEPKGSVQVIPPGEIAHKITRADLAQFLVDQLTSDRYLGQAVTIANT